MVARGLSRRAELGPERTTTPMITPTPVQPGRLTRVAEARAVEVEASPRVRAHRCLARRGATEAMTVAAAVERMAGAGPRLEMPLASMPSLSTKAMQSGDTAIGATRSMLGKMILMWRVPRILHGSATCRITMELEQGPPETGALSRWQQRV